MGGVAEGVGIANKTSRRAEIEKVQAALRQEYDFREKRKRELEFLEKGGDPLEFFKDRNAASVSVQSTSFTNQLPDQLTSEAKGSFALTASPHGDSVESSGRLGTNPREPNSADNLMLFDAENDGSKGGMNSSQPIRNDIAPSEKLSQMDGNQISRGHGGSAAFSIPRKAYKRRNRSRPNRDGTRSSSTDVNPTLGSHSSLTSHHGPRVAKGFTSDAEIQNAQPNCNSKPTSPIVGSLHKNGSTSSQQEFGLTRGKSVESSKGLTQGVPPDTVSDAVASETVPSDQHNQHSPSRPTKTLKMDSDVPDVFQTKGKMDAAAVECVPSATNFRVENLSNSCQMKDCSDKKGEEMKNADHDNSGLRVVKTLDSESSCTHTSLSIDANNDNEMCTELRNADSNGNIKDQTLAPDEMPIGGEDGVIKGKTEIVGVDNSIPFNVENSSAQQSQDNGVVNQSGSALEDKASIEFASKGTESCVPTGLESGKKPSEILAHNPVPQKENSCNVHDNSISIVNLEPREGVPVSIDAQLSSSSASILPREVDEDSILKEAQIIEAKRKRIGELSFATSPKQIHSRSHWDLVLEEMAWLANDFAQERVWKIAAAAQISTRAAFTIRLRNQEKCPGFVGKKVANNMAKSVLEFWRSIEEASEGLEQQSQTDGTLPVKDYALRFMDYNKSNTVHQAEVPSTPDRLSDMGVLELSWEDNLTEENLFYTVLPGAMEAYKNSIESHVSHCERVRNSAQEEVETSTCDAAAGGELESLDNMYDEDEGETNTYDVSIAFEASRSSRLGQKKRKHLKHAYRYDPSFDFYGTQYAENKPVAHQSALVGKRPGGNHNVSIPTKRVRTASRRVISPFGGGTPGFVQAPTKTEASSGDNNSFQDDRSSLHGGSFVPNHMEVESAGDFEKHLPFDSAEVSTKHKKKKKSKHLKSAYGPRWQVDSTFQNEQFQKDRIRKIYQFDSNGSSGLLGQPMMKKPKIMLQSQDNSFENITPIGGSVPSPAASQMSNMSNPNKVIKLLGGRDRGRKHKVLKMPAGQLGSASPWTLFEDQALVVLVHDMGPNWELVSDAFNSTVQFKCVFRKANECKERHHYLMDRTSGDGADSAEDSGSSQPYPSTLPGIPKGSARQLFQRLQGPMEEDTIKSHFEKIIIIGQKLLHHKAQNDNQDPRQLQQPHNSHAIALSQVCPNNLNGGPVLTPLDLCDATANGSDIIPVGYQGPPGGLAIPNQATGTPIPGNSSMLPGSPNVISGNNFSSSPGALNPSVRYGVPRPTALSADEQRLQQYSQIVSSRNIAQSHVSSPGAIPGTDRGIRLHPGSNGVGLACGVNRNIPMSRHGFQGIGPSSIANSGCMVSPGVTPANMHSGVGSGQGSSMLRPREALHAVRPSLGQDSPRQVMAPDLQMQASPGNGQGASHFGGLSSPVPNSTASPPVSSYPLHHQPTPPPQQPQVLSPHQSHISANHAPTPQQQAYAIRLAKEKQQHRLLQQQQFASSSSVLPHVQSQSQLPMSSPVQNSSQVQLQNNSPPVPLSPLTSASMSSMPQHPQKHQIPTQVVPRNAQSGNSGVINQTNKQRHRQHQQFSQASRQHPQPRQQLQGQQQSKALKGVGRGNMMAQPNISADPNLVNRVSTNPGNQSLEKGEPAGHLMQNQALCTGSALNAVQPIKQHVSSPSSSNSLTQQKIYAGQAAASSTVKNINQLVSHSGNSSQGHVPSAAPSLSTGQQSILAMTGPNQQLKLVNPNQSALRRAIQSNRQINSNPSNKPQARDSDTDRHPTSSCEMDAVTTSPQGNSSATNLVSASPSSAHQWHVSDAQTLNSATDMNSLASIPPNSSESTPQVSQGLGQRPPSTSLPTIRPDANAQWQHQASQLQQPNSPAPQPHQHPPQLPPLHSQKQAQLLQAGNGNLHGRNGDHRLE